MEFGRWRPAWQGFIRPQPRLRPRTGGETGHFDSAGTGIGPLAGFARATIRAVLLASLFWCKHPDSRLFYEFTKMEGEWQKTGQLAFVSQRLLADQRSHLCAGMLLRTRC